MIGSDLIERPVFSDRGPALTVFGIDFGKSVVFPSALAVGQLLTGRLIFLESGPGLGLLLTRSLDRDFTFISGSLIICTLYPKFFAILTRPGANV